MFVRDGGPAIGSEANALVLFTVTAFVSTMKRAAAQRRLGERTQVVAGNRIGVSLTLIDQGPSFVRRRRGSPGARGWCRRPSSIPYRCIRIYVGLRDRRSDQVR